MKKKYNKISNQLSMTGICRTSQGKKVVDYYVSGAKGESEYVFTRPYTKRTYEMVKGGISVKRLLLTKSKDKMVMKLVNYVSIMMPCLMEEIEWVTAA